MLIAVSLAVLCGMVVLVWRASATAAAHASFNLPAVSSQPCVLVLALLPTAVFVAAHRWRRAARTRVATAA
jgi:hypothetical protein